MTALWAVLDLIVYRLEDNSLHLIFNFPLAKIYTNSLMSTLNARRAHAEALRGPYSGDGEGMGGSGTPGLVNSDGLVDSWGFKVTPKSGETSTIGGTIGAGEVGHSIFSFFPISPSYDFISTA
jgi:hypothetical protein